VSNGGDRDMILLWDVTTGKQLNADTVEMGIRRLLFSPDARRLVVERSGQHGRPWSIALFDPQTWKETIHWQGADAEPQDLVFAPDGRTLCSAWTPRDSVLAWDTASGKPGPRLQADPPVLETLSCTPTGELRFVDTSYRFAVSLSEGKDPRSIQFGKALQFPL